MPYLAQLNIGKLRYPIDHPNTQEFVENIDRINQLAEASPGFVWRLKDDTGNATSIQVFSDPMMIVNMSVWESIDSLKQFVYRSDHIQIMQKRQQWFEKYDEPFVVLWWVTEGYLLTLSDAKQKLALLTKKGATVEAFSFRKTFDPLKSA